jgi:hypothetical protein
LTCLQALYPNDLPLPGFDEPWTAMTRWWK